MLPAASEANEMLASWAKLHRNTTLFLDLAKELPLAKLSGFIRDVYWDDAVHPSKVGYRKVADLLFEVVSKLYDNM